MARQPQPEDGSSSRQQSAPINIEYGNNINYNQERYWNNHEENYHWQPEVEDEEQQHLEDEHDIFDDDFDEDQLTMMQNGFSGGVIEPPEEVERRHKAEEIENDVVEQFHHQRHFDETIRRQKSVEMNDDDLFEQLLAENERKLRQLISYVENVHLVLK